MITDIVFHIFSARVKYTVCPCEGCVYVQVLSVRVVSMSGLCPYPGNVRVRVVSVRVASCPGCVLSGLCLSGLRRSTVYLTSTVRMYPKVIRPIRTQSGLINYYIHRIKGTKILTLQHLKMKKKCWFFQISLAFSENLSLNSFTAYTHFP